ncbi:hypothetical protein IE53DRAFT_359825 [Violaceomyces palustris]|uniref:Uncharacterized protein n=1 Tax=Violaceomyces palustris TaxID=1673888 RepID=A0ACD0P6L1_9BASI|nr:hypothetical protein IE53DRAFT_359825 [Violaceomyces palustris]
MIPIKKASLLLTLSVFASSAAASAGSQTNVQNSQSPLILGKSLRHRRHHHLAAQRRGSILGDTLQGLGDSVSGLGQILGGDLNSNSGSSGTSGSTQSTSNGSSDSGSPSSGSSGSNAAPSSSDSSQQGSSTQEAPSSSSNGASTTVTMTSVNPSSLSTSAVPATSTYGGNPLSGTGETVNNNNDNDDDDSSSGSGSNTSKIVIPIVVVAAVLALIGVAYSLYRRRQKSKGYYEADPRLRPIDYEPNGPPAFAVGSASAGPPMLAVAGGMRSRDRRSESFYDADRPMSSLTELTEDDGLNHPPMVEVAGHNYGHQAYSYGSGYNFVDTPPVVASVGGASTPARLRNYGTRTQTVGSDRHMDEPPSDYAYNVPEEDEGPMYYDGSARSGYSSPAAKGLDVAGADRAGPSSYSPYTDLQRGSFAENDDAYDGAYISLGNASKAGDASQNPFDDAISKPVRNSSRWSG